MKNDDESKEEKEPPGNNSGRQKDPEADANGKNRNQPGVQRIVPADPAGRDPGAMSVERGRSLCMMEVIVP